MGFNNPLTGLNGSLIYPQIKSPNFSLTGETGWAILKNGDAYFFNVVATGTITASEFIGTDFIIDSAGMFFYNGTPAAGNLILALAPVSGTDAFGNNYGAGFTAGATGSQEQIRFGVLAGSPLEFFLSGISTALNNAALMLNVSGAGTAAYDTLVIKSSQDSAHTDYVAIQLTGNSNDGVAQDTTLQLAYVNTGGIPTFYLSITAAGMVFPAGFSVVNTDTFNVLATGRLTWGSGSTATDTVLYRSAAATLTANTVLAVEPGFATLSEVWHTITVFGAGFAAGTMTPRYRYMADGTVLLDGLIQTTGAVASSAAIFTLPSGYLPSEEQFCNNSTTLSGKTSLNSTMVIQTSGVVVTGCLGAAAGENIFLSGVRFPVI